MLAAIGCSTPTATTLPRENSYAGVKLYWSDMGGSTRTYPITASWSFLPDSSKARLVARNQENWRDTLDFSRSNEKWSYFKDGTDWQPEIHWTADSLTIGIGYGFTVESYYLRKQ